MLIKYSRHILLALMLIVMSVSSAYAAGKDHRHKRCVNDCKAAHNRAKDACRHDRRGDRRQCMREADDAFRSCKDGCPR
jgi:hypothetical protein